MSLILDALARSEREKQALEGQAVDLPASSAAPPLTSFQRLAGRLALIAVLLAALGWWLLRPSAHDRAPTERSPADEAAPPTPPPAVVAPTRAESESSGDAVTDTVAEERKTPAAPLAGTALPDAVAALYDAGAGSAPEGLVASAKTVSAAEDSATRADTPAASASAALDEPAATAPKPPVDKPIDLARILREVQAERSARALLPHPAPMLADRSKPFRDSVPTLIYLRHDYRSAGNSAVTINGQSLQVGARTRGVEVREILRDSVILHFQGTDFRLRALNSWVNL